MKIRIPILEAAFAFALVASPALASVIIKAPAADFPTSPGGSITIPVGGVVIISNGNRIGVFNPTTNSYLPGLSLTSDLSEITAMAFVAPGLLTLEGGSYGQVISFLTFPPTKKMYFTLP